MQLARDKNGSTYEALINDGHTTTIWISNVTQDRKIEVHPQDSIYFYIPIRNPGGKLPIYSVEETFKTLQAEQDSTIKSPIIQVRIRRDGISQHSAAGRKIVSTYAASEMRALRIPAKCKQGTRGDLIWV